MATHLKYFFIKIGFLGALSIGTSVAAPPEFWENTTVAVECKTNSIRDALQNVSEIYSIDVEIEESVSGECYGWLKHRSIIELLDSLASTHGLSWYVFNNILYIADTKNFRIERIDIDEELYAAFKSLKLVEAQYGWSYLAQTEQVLVNGPSSYIENIEGIIKSNQIEKKHSSSVQVKPPVAKEQASENKESIFIIPIRHASVIDRRIDIRGSSLEIPGIATVLKRVLSGSVESDESEDTDIQDMFSLRGSSSRVHIEADTRTNSIVIRSPDKPESYFTQIIAALDTPLELIEIDAMIVDVNRETFFEIGNRYGYQSSENGDSVSVDILDNGVSNISAVLSIDNYAQFFADLRLLEGRGEANIVANTSILTIENQPALIDLSNTFYIRSVGENVANVTPVTSGTLLNITPQLLADESGDEVQLIINIEDGKILDKVVDDLPVVSRSAVSTKAIIEAGKSLVIGGYRLQSNEQSRRSVPILGDIPFLGKLFSYKSTEIADEERLFVITPRISTKSHEPIKKFRSDINSRFKQNISSFLPGEIDAAYAKSRVDKSADMFREILESSDASRSYEVSEYASLGAPFSCYSNGLAFEFFGLPSFGKDGITVYKIKVINKSEGQVGVPEYSCKGRGLIAAINAADRTLSVGGSTYLLAAFDTAVAQF